MFSPNLDQTQITTTGIRYGVEFGVISYRSLPATKLNMCEELRLLRNVPEKNLLSVTLYALQPIPKFVRPTIRFPLWLDLHDTQDRPSSAPNRNYFP